MISYIIISVAIIGSLLGVYSYINRQVGLPDDNPIEEVIEEGIKAATGQDIDLTPDSPEVEVED